ncbi:PE-PPE domain-containing protein [Nocardia arizonensis]|uniref:PE-PPE domain-containing protein n=1 Tax=Nocardia arizonensis TaxID=1141647 RepID=UPI0006D05F56|nr:PE-PPE domain-containing protein [Nocardia arizonensis]
MYGSIPEEIPALRHSLSRRPVDVLIVGGTWHPNGDGITAAFSAALDPARYRPRMVPYPAEYGGALAYADSLAAGRDALVRAVESTADRVILAGYSQGAAVAGDIAAAIGAGELSAPRVLACALIADPLRPAGECVGADPGGYGIAGQRQVPNVPAFWAAAPGDPITALPAGNPLRGIADLGAYFSYGGTDAALRWGRNLLDAATRGQLQRWWSPWSWGSWIDAIGFARGYLVDGLHTDDYIRHGHARRLARELDGWVLDRAGAR